MKPPPLVICRPDRVQGDGAQAEPGPHDPDHTHRPHPPPVSPAPLPSFWRCFPRLGHPCHVMLWILCSPSPLLLFLPTFPCLIQWKSEISKKRQAFTDQSVKVKEWDNALVRNNEQIMKLQKEVNNVKVHQHRYVGSPDPPRSFLRCHRAIDAALARRCAEHTHASSPHYSHGAGSQNS